MDKDLMQKLKDKLNNDYVEIRKELEKQDKDFLINNAYGIAIINNFEDGFEEYFDVYEDMSDDFLTPQDFIFNDDIVNKIINYKGNIFKHLKDSYMDFNHPERYNIWFSYFDGLAEVIELIMENDYESICG